MTKAEFKKMTKEALAVKIIEGENMIGDLLEKIKELKLENAELDDKLLMDEPESVAAANKLAEMYEKLVPIPEMTEAEFDAVSAGLAA